MDSINYNGRIIPADKPIFGTNHRGLRYGDGLFETCLFTKGQVPLLPLHLQRLHEGMKVLGIECPLHFGSAFFEAEIKKLGIKVDTARIRLSVFRKVGGLYTPETDEAEFLIEWASVLPDPPTFIAQSGLLPQYPLTPNLLSPFKTANSLPYILASRQKKAMGWEEGILLNQIGRVADGCHSNIFAVKKEQLLTPPVSEGALAGVMRSLVIQLAKQLEIELEIRPITVNELLEVDELWFSNAVRGIRWVHTFENRSLKNSIWHEFFQKLEGLWKNESITSFHWYKH